VTRHGLIFRNFQFFDHSPLLHATIYDYENESPTTPSSPNSSLTSKTCSSLVLPLVVSGLWDSTSRQFARCDNQLVATCRIPHIHASGLVPARTCGFDCYVSVITLTSLQFHATNPVEMLRCFKENSQVPENERLSCLIHCL